ncbi:MAG TPA: sigma-70 family RNA polymerase sigma factor [Pyrinomonadaceae bacterium]
MKKEVSQEAFAGFLKWLGPEDEGAGEGYVRLCYKLQTFFAHRGCRFPEELADETINRLVLKAAEEKIENKLAYCYGVAKNVYRESLRKERDHLDLDDVVVAAPPPARQGFTDECLDRCLAELSPESRSMILDYFSEEKRSKIEQRRRISERLGMTQTALRMYVMRTKRMLSDCMQKCVGGGAVT